jgi:hypothetical protein
MNDTDLSHPCANGSSIRKLKRREYEILPGAFVVFSSVLFGD